MAHHTIDQEGPRPNNDKDKDIQYSKGKKLTAALLGAGAIGFFAHQSLDPQDTMFKTIQEQIDEHYQEAMAERGYDITNEAPVVLDKNDPAAYEPRKNEYGMEYLEVQYPTGLTAQGEIRERLIEHSKNFDEWRQMTLDILVQNNHLSAEQQEFLQENLATLSAKSDKSDYTDNEVLAAVALDISDATSQEDGSVGQEMLPVVYSKNNSNYAEFKDHAKSIETSILDVWRQNGVTYERPKDHYFQGEDFGQVKDARVIVRNRINDIGEEDAEPMTKVTIYVLNDDGNGNEQWQLFKDYDPDKPSVEAELVALHPQR